jgi:hypothetical protein
MATELNCESTYSYTFTYTVPTPAPYVGTGKTEEEAKKEAAKKVPVDTSTTAQDEARKNAKETWSCAGPCQRNIATGEASFPAVVGPSGTGFTATISSALVPVTITCKKITVTAVAAAVVSGEDQPAAVTELVSEFRGLLARRETEILSDLGALLIRKGLCD